MHHRQQNHDNKMCHADDQGNNSTKQNNDDELEDVNRQRQNQQQQPAMNCDLNPSTEGDAIKQQETSFGDLVGDLVTEDEEEEELEEDDDDGDNNNDNEDDEDEQDDQMNTENNQIENKLDTKALNTRIYENSSHQSSMKQSSSKQHAHQSQIPHHNHNQQSNRNHHQQQQQVSHQNHIQLLMNALEKLDPDKNGLSQVPKEITSSTLTTRLKGISKINRLIDHANDLSHSFIEIGAQEKHQECIDKFRDWVIKNRIIEHIFGPNCHVEIIKQSHIILNFVAYSLNDEHVNVIWSASLLKHCGRQVLDLLTSLIRSMKPGPVLHAYWLVKNLSVEDHSEHTLLLTSHILRFIWSHSPSITIDDLQFCNIQKIRTHSNLSEDQHYQQELHQVLPNQLQNLTPTKRRSIKQSHVQQQFSQKQFRNQQQRNLLEPNRLKIDSVNEKDVVVVESSDVHCATYKSNENVNSNISTASSTTIANTTSNVNFTSEEHYQWLASLFPSENDEQNERATSSRSTSESVDLDKTNLQQSFIDAIKGVTQRQHQQQKQSIQRSSISPIEETSDKPGSKCEDDQGADVVDRILQSIQSRPETTSQNVQSDMPGMTAYSAMASHCNQPEADEDQWLQWKNNDFLDTASDASACCSEKNMNDFDDDDVQGFVQDENTISSDTIGLQPASSVSELYSQVAHNSHQNQSYRSDMKVFKNMNSGESSSRSNEGNRGEILDMDDSNDEPSRDSFNARYRSHPNFGDDDPPPMSDYLELKRASYRISCSAKTSPNGEFKGLSEYNLVNLSDPSKTLLWDLLQDGKIEHLAANLHVEIENVLVNLIMSFGDRYIRYKFIEACLENLSVGTSVIISLRLLPRLMSVNSMTRNLPAPAISETHTIVIWAEREYNMSQNFFKSLVDYYRKRGEQLLQITHSKLILSPNEERLQQLSAANEQLRQQILEEYDNEHCKSPLFSHLDKIITRMSFLTFIYSRPFSPDSMRLTREQLDQLWECLTSDGNLKCSDVLFQWIYQQSMSEEFHGLNGESFDYILNCKLPSLEPEYFRLRGLKLLEQLMWNKQEYECCHGLVNPATRLLWAIGLKAKDDEVSMAAIRILNHFYIYSNHNNSMKCDKGINFMNNCMEHLHSALSNLTNSDKSKSNMKVLLDVMHKVILLIRTHLEVFRAHWSYYLRILQLNNEADLISHRLNAYEIKLTMTVRLVCQAASTMDKTTIEVQASDFVGELRAEIVKWWFSRVDKTYFEHLHHNTASVASRNQLSPNSSTSSSSSTSSNNAQNESKNDHQQTTASNKIRTQSFLSNADDTMDPNNLHSFTEFLLANRHSLRLLSHNQEIPSDWDERQINELDFKDMQVIYVLNDVKTNSSVDPTDDIEESKSNDSIVNNYPPKTEIPSILLLRYEYFERLMEADRFLGLFHSNNFDLNNRSKTLSRRVWEIIQILPTCPYYKEDLKRCGMSNEDWRLKTAQCSSLLSAECPQRLLYSLQIIDILKSSDNSYWGLTFIKKGGLADIFDVFMSQKLLPENDEEWNEWLQECLAYLLKLLLAFGTKPNIPIPLSSAVNESSSSSTSSKLSICSNRNNVLGNNSNASIKRVRRNRLRQLGVLTEDRLPIPLFSDQLLRLLADTELVFNKLIRILKSSAMSKSQADQYYYVTMSSRAMIVLHVMSFLSSWCKSDPKFPKFQIADHKELLKALILDDTDSSIRREACSGFFKLHHASTLIKTTAHNISLDSTNSTLNSSIDSSSCVIDSSLMERNQRTSFELTDSWTFSSDMLKCLIEFLPIAEAMKPPRPIRNYVSENDYIKELNSPGCKDYFWLTCRLIDSQATTNLNISDREKFSCSPENNQKRDSTSPVKEAPHKNSDPVVDDLEKNVISDRHDESMQKNAGPEANPSAKCSVNLFELCEYLVVAIRKRQTYETRDFSVEDDTLRGMLLMMVMALRRDSTFRYTNTAFEFIHELYEYLFAPPNQTQRYLPKCKSPATRSTAFDLMIALVERCPRNYFGLLDLLLVDQHNSVVKSTYPTDYWPHDDCRSEVGFVGLINLGATCYLATCMQHLFMIPNLRYAILSIEDTKNIRHGEIIKELQKIFTFMLESERKAYNPRNFCRVYTMDNHPLNIAEQTDMTEFLTDLITKLEESSPELRQIIKELFSGTLSNNVVSLDCPHISRTTEEFYTLRVQVADMRNLNDSLDELTVKDTLEGDNMYTCSTCEKKVRAEKRACIVKLPRILCFNTMRYTFNMATMTKEKVNTHFSFPLKLDMADYLETNLMKRQQSSSTASSCSSKESTTGSNSSTENLRAQSEEDKVLKNTVNLQKQDGIKNENADEERMESPESYTSEAANNHSDQSHQVNKHEQESDTMYELIGVTVHTGNADGGHYYCFIRDCEDQSSDKPRWYLFNDAEVKPFDDSHIGSECYGGELTTKSYDAINDRFMDFSIEKTNSAYMLFYKRMDYRYHSRSVAQRYLESDTQRSTIFNMFSGDEIQYVSTPIYKKPDEELMHGMDVENIKAMNQDLEEGKHGVSPHCDDHAMRQKSPRSGLEMNRKGSDFNSLSNITYDDFKLPKFLANWIWSDNMKFARDKNVFEHNYFNFMWQVCANLPRSLNNIPEHLILAEQLSSQQIRSSSVSQASEDAIAIRTVHLAIAFVLGVLMNSRERPNLPNWTELIRKQFGSSKAACDWLMHLIDDEETWLKQMLLKCPIEMVRQLFQRLCNDLTGSKQHKKLRLIR